jgi:Tetratricopeptide repeat
MIFASSYIGIPRLLSILVLCVLATFTRTSGAQIADAVQAFDEGTRLLHEGDFVKALERFRRAEETGLASAGLYYNTGFAYYRLNESGEAVRYFTRASRLLPDDARITHNLAIVSARLTDRLSTLPTPIWKTAQQWLLGILSISALFVIGLILFLTAMTMLGLTILQIGHTSWYSRFLPTTLTLAVLFLVMALASTRWPAWPQEAVILSDVVSLREQPDPESVESMQIHEGLIVSTLSSVDGWTLVQLPNGARGWMEDNSLGAI